MGKKLAIKGHPTRGWEVIGLLEMLGGDNIYGHWYGDQENMRYFINEQGNIDNGYLMANCNNYEVFTLEEFWEKYPFKVGDKVVYEDDNDIVVINEIKWDNTVGDIFYNVKRIDENDCFLCPPELLKPYKETNMKENKVESTGFMQMGKIVSVIFNSANYEDEVELQLGDYEIDVRDGKTYAVKKKPKYPDNYDECVRIAKNIHGYDIHIDTPAYRELMESFVKLLICRDAYWKIAGDEMGLDKPWEPKFGKTILFDITFYLYQDNLVLHKGEYPSSDICILAFPTEEMRDTFYENFKDLIEQCKELL